MELNFFPIKYFKFSRDFSDCSIGSGGKRSKEDGIEKKKNSVLIEEKEEVKMVNLERRRGLDDDRF